MSDRLTFLTAIALQSYGLGGWGGKEREEAQRWQEDKDVDTQDRMLPW